jgi:hypothetical protein
LFIVYSLENRTSPSGPESNENFSQQALDAIVTKFPIEKRTLHFRSLSRINYTGADPQGIWRAPPVRQKRPSNLGKAADAPRGRDRTCRSTYEVSAGLGEDVTGHVHEA